MTSSCPVLHSDHNVTSRVCHKAHLTLDRCVVHQTETKTRKNGCHGNHNLQISKVVAGTLALAGKSERPKAVAWNFIIQKPVRIEPEIEGNIWQINLFTPQFTFVICQWSTLYTRDFVLDVENLWKCGNKSSEQFYILTCICIIYIKENAFSLGAFLFIWEIWILVPFL